MLLGTVEACSSVIEEHALHTRKYSRKAEEVPCVDGMSLVGLHRD
jgi:hypothetical protein